MLLHARCREDKSIPIFTLTYQDLAWQCHLTLILVKQQHRDLHQKLAGSQIGMPIPAQHAIPSLALTLEHHLVLWTCVAPDPSLLICRTKLLSDCAG